MRRLAAVSRKIAPIVRSPLSFMSAPRRFSASSATVSSPGTFLYVSRICAALEVLAARNAGTALLAVAFLDTLRANRDFLAPMIRILLGEVAPTHQGMVLGIGDVLATSAIALAAGLNRDGVSQAVTSCGDLGRAAASLFASRPACLTTTGGPLSSVAVLYALTSIAEEAGQDSRQRKLDKIVELYRQCYTATEVKYLTRLMERQGQGDGLGVFMGSKPTLQALGYAVAKFHASDAPAMLDRFSTWINDPITQHSIERSTTVAVDEQLRRDMRTTVLELFHGMLDDGQTVLAKHLFSIFAKRPDIDSFAKMVAASLDKPVANLESWPPAYFVPVRSMSSEAVSGINELCERLRNFEAGFSYKASRRRSGAPIRQTVAAEAGRVLARLEWKYDGERVQIHALQQQDAGGVSQSGYAVRVFSRYGEDVTFKYGTIGKQAVRAALASQHPPSGFIIEGEAVGMKANRFLPFVHVASLQRKQARKTENAQPGVDSTSLVMFAFDLLMIDGKDMLGAPLSGRLEQLASRFQQQPSTFSMAKSVDLVVDGGLYRAIDNTRCIASGALDYVVLKVVEMSVKDGCEGIMVKAVDGPLSVYQPGERTMAWLKLKKDYAGERAVKGVGINDYKLGGDTFDVVPVGAFYGKGKRSGLFGAFLTACYNSTAGHFETLCCVGTGFSDDELQALTKALQPLSQPNPRLLISSTFPVQRRPDVWFDPLKSPVWELTAADISQSPIHTAASTRTTAVVASSSRKTKHVGLSLRFPRFLRERPDKKPTNATDSDQIWRLYEKQTA